MVGNPSHSTYIHSPISSQASSAAALPFRLLPSQDSYLSPTPNTTDPPKLRYILEVSPPSNTYIHTYQFKSTYIYIHVCSYAVHYLQFTYIYSIYMCPNVIHTYIHTYINSIHTFHSIPVPGAPMKARSISLNGCADTEHERSDVAHPDLSRNSRAAQRKRLLLLHDPRKVSSGGLPIGKMRSVMCVCMYVLYT